MNAITQVTQFPWKGDILDIWRKGSSLLILVRLSIKAGSEDGC